MNQKNTARFNALSLTLLMNEKSELQARAIHREFTQEANHFRRNKERGLMTEDQRKEATTREHVRCLQRLEALAEYHGITV